MFRFTLPLQFTFIEIFHFENIDVLIKKNLKVQVLKLKKEGQK